METITVVYNVKNEFVRWLLKSLFKVIGIRITEEYVLTSEEEKLIEKSINSGIQTDISRLKEILKS
jgi:nickel-dependent lactate racemase